MIAYQFNNHDLKRYRQSLRNAMPQPEMILWSKLQGSQLMGCKFRRQYSVGGYIVDFYCPKLRLAIEIDGDSHFNLEAEQKDKLREQFIREFNITVLRFTNKEICTNCDGVLEKLVSVIESTTPNPS